MYSPTLGGSHIPTHMCVSPCLVVIVGEPLVLRHDLIPICLACIDEHLFYTVKSENLAFITKVHTHPLVVIKCHVIMFDPSTMLRCSRKSYLFSTTKAESSWRFQLGCLLLRTHWACASWPHGGGGGRFLVTSKSILDNNKLTMTSSCYLYHIHLILLCLLIWTLELWNL